MRRDTKVKSANLAGTSDLTIVAPIKKGFVPSLDAVTYKTRAQRVLRTLHGGRTNAHEFELARTLSDAVERVGRIHSIRIAILEPEDKVMLAVTFDGSWESYIRVIWQKVSRSLDLIFCNTEEYVCGWTNSFERWCAWLRSRQAETAFLYSPASLTYRDTQYLRIYEPGLRRESNLAKADLAAVQIHIPAAEEISDSICKDGLDPSHPDFSQKIDEVAARRPAFRQGMAGLAGLYRLADLHLPGTGDGDVLHRAAVELLREFIPMLNNPSKYEQAIRRAEVRFQDALDWFRQAEPLDRLLPALPDDPPDSEFADVQGGIVESYPAVSDGCLLLLAFDSPSALGSFLGAATPTKATDTIGDDHIVMNVAITLEGLRLAGLQDSDVNELPAEFVQGMERRAGLLGDIWINHPRRWRLPPLNWDQGLGATDVTEADPCPRVELGCVHLVLQLRMCNATASTPDPKARIHAKIQALLSALTGARPLSLQWMSHLVLAGRATEHFGFVESQSQPVLRKSEAGRKYPNHVHLGEVLMGYDNAADSALASTPSAPTRKMLKNGSFLVIRKLRQDIGVLESALEAAVKATLREDTVIDTMDQKAREDMCRNLFLAKMMGRWPGTSKQPGEALATSFGKDGNDFNFNNDKKGSACPFHAHIRRANPRDTSEPEPPGARPARIVRRGMSYGPSHDRGAGEEDRAESLALERGLLFMAYNASIGEQFEVVQRWLTGGNSSGSYSGQSDPFMGIAAPGRQRFFRFEHDSQSLRIGLDGVGDRMHDEPHPLVRLEWGMYLFTPSLSALADLAGRALNKGDTLTKSWSSDEGELEVARLRRIEQTDGTNAAFAAWKAAVEDPISASEFTAASIWAAIRQNHAGVLKTPYGVLVASRELVGAVLLDTARELTATGYLPRMQRSFGTLYLGLDAGQAEQTYERESLAANRAIVGLVDSREKFEQAVSEAARVTRKTIQALAVQAEHDAKEDGETHWRVSFDAREAIDELLAHFCELWFGLSDKGGYLKRGGVHWRWRHDDPPSYPGHFMAPSRYTFQPHPGPEVEQIGSANGQALRLSIASYLAAYGKDLSAPVIKQILQSDAATCDASYPARTLAGVLMGFLPTTDGNLRRVLSEWLSDGTLWSLRAEGSRLDKQGDEAKADFRTKLRAKFVSAMQLRAAPELLWRTASVGHVIGEPGPHQVRVQTGEIVIASLISATQQCLEEGDPSVEYAFGAVPGPGARPTHACPGYGPAMAVMFGFFQGLTEAQQSLRPGPGPLTLSMEGCVTLPEKCRSREADRKTSPREHNFLIESTEYAGLWTRSIPVMGIGDSWLKAPEFFSSLYPPSLASSLLRLGYKYASGKSDEFKDIGLKLSQIATVSMTKKIGQYLADLEGTSDKPKAILMGAGGNDLVDPSARPSSTALYALLTANAEDSASALIEDEVKKFIDIALLAHYKSILDVVTTSSTGIPILIHAYDHPIPDGKQYSGFGGSRGPWLKTVFDAKGVTANIAVRRAIMRVLIDRLNCMVKTLETSYTARVFHLKLNGVLASQPDFESNIRNYWDNELHASAKGFDVLAQAAKDRLVALGVT